MHRIFILFFCVALTIPNNIFAQSRRQIQKETKELQRHIDKLNLKIIIRDIDLTKVFVVQNKIERRDMFSIHDPKSEEESWNQALFINGLDVGIYSLDKKGKNEALIKGDYLMEVYNDMVKFVDLHDKRLVATIMYNLNTIKYKNQVIEHIIQEFLAKVNEK